MSSRRARWRVTVLLAVLAVHIGLVYFGWTLKVAVSVTRDTPIVTQLRLIPLQPLALAPTQARRSPEGGPGAGRDGLRPVPRVPSRDQLDQLSAPAAPVPVEPKAVAHGVVPAGRGQVGLDGSENAAAVEAPASHPASSHIFQVRSASGLALTPEDKVMQGTPKNPALTDPRSNTPKPTFEERFAIGMNPDLCVKVERLPDGSTRRSLVQRVRVPTLAATRGVGAASVGVCP
ncbi:hypothetical protein KGA65_04815 [Ideonella sp. B7]|uniref:hypothetical protein n=1 Tax=Ideonella benzenivorans TaxID=2831643 RepID=UPI001CEC83A4|nr:hypothetical protein [Ideonella benzenivorans]MCA6215864.1 hypothetical protein [Ideonella benzenivorans]